MNLSKRNVGYVDRIIRVVLGIVLIGNVFFALQHPIGWISVLLVATGIAGMCPLYSLVGADTRSTSGKVGLK